MKARRVIAVTRKEFLHVLRDPRSLGMAIAIPMLMLLLFGYALTLDVDRVPLVVWDQDETPLSRALVADFDGSPYFTVVEYADRYATIENAVDRRTVMGGLVIPRGFAGDMATGKGDAVQFIVDGSDSNTATIAIGYAEVIVEIFGQDLIADQFRRATGRELRIPLEVRSRVWFNADLQSRNFIIPGLIAVIMMVTGMIEYRSRMITSFLDKFEKGTDRMHQERRSRGLKKQSENLIRIADRIHELAQDNAYDVRNLMVHLDRQRELSNSEGGNTGHHGPVSYIQ